MKKVLLVLALLAPLGACATAGVNVKINQAMSKDGRVEVYAANIAVHNGKSQTIALFREIDGYGQPIPGSEVKYASDSDSNMTRVVDNVTGAIIPAAITGGVALAVSNKEQCSGQCGGALVVNQGSTAAAAAKSGSASTAVTDVEVGVKLN